MFCLTACGKSNDILKEPELTAIVHCVDSLKVDIKTSNSINNIYGENYVFEINGPCTYTILNSAYRIHIPSKISNTGRNDLIDIAYFINGFFVGSEIDYEYEIYKTWDSERQALFYIARLDSFDKIYPKEIVTKAINDK